ncbi:MAG: peptidylprolyl isomerase [Clostridia bacterium]|nr:peptidylprolyl isomerase [Clostridia bacterium]
MLKKILGIMLSFAVLLSMAGCNKKEEAPKNTSEPEQTQQAAADNQENQSSEAESPELYADAIPFTIELENGGVMKGELYPNLAPKTVENFVKLVNEKFYDGLIFHRVIEGFMIQGGGYDTEMNIKEADEIVGEFASNGFKNPLKHTKGVISMARTNEPDSASSQFFIMHEDTSSLDGQYAAFGRITEGLDVIDEIAEGETTNDPKYGMPDYPVKPVVIKTIKIDK